MDIFYYVCYIVNTSVLFGYCASIFIFRKSSFIFCYGFFPSIHDKGNVMEQVHLSYYIVENHRELRGGVIMCLKYTPFSICQFVLLFKAFVKYFVLCGYL